MYFFYKLFSQKLKLFILIFITLILSSNILYGSEIKSLSEIKKSNIENYSQILMNRCAVIYAALSILEKNTEYENRYKIFLQSSILDKLDKDQNLNEQSVYKDSISEFKISLSFILQILEQNYKINQSFLMNHWLEDDFNTCKKL